MHGLDSAVYTEPTHVHRKRELYDLEWDVDLSKHVVVGAQCGGALGTNAGLLIACT